jgi:hypothetical protein
MANAMLPGLFRLGAGRRWSLRFTEPEKTMGGVASTQQHREDAATTTPTTG